MVYTTYETHRNMHIYITATSDFDSDSILG